MIETLLSSLRREGVHIWSENGRVRYRAPQGVMTRERIEEIRARQYEITAFLEEARSQAGELPPIKPRDVAGPLPLSFAQERLWFLDQLGLSGSSYHIAATIRLEGVLDVNALEFALTELVRRHESLRTRFDSLDGCGVQIVDAPLSYRLEQIDLSHLSPDAQATEARRASRDHALQRFDLRTVHPLRCTLLRLAAEQHLLLLAMHHIVSDAWSSEVLIGEICSLYAAFHAGKPSPLEPLPIQYADYALWQRQWLDGEVLQRELAFWTQRLSGAPFQLDLPTDRTRSPQPSLAGATHWFAIPERISSALRLLALRENATLFMVLLAAFQLLLSRYCGQTDLLIGSPVAGRRRHELQNLIGFFANILVLRTDCSGRQSFKELLKQVKATVLEAYAHQDLPFEKLVEALQPDRDMARHPLVQVMFALQQAPFEALRLPGLKTIPVPAENPQTKFDLTFHAYEAKSGLDISIEYAAELFDRSSIERLGRHFQQLLDSIVANPDCGIIDLDLLNAAERHELLIERNDTVRPYPRNRSLHEMFAEQAARAPDAVAIDDGARRISYHDLDVWSDGIAAGLRGLGVKPGAAVGLSGGRSAALIAGMLGILKAGGCYVPLDPGYPQERLAFMVADAGLSAVVVGPGGIAPANLRSLRADDAHAGDGQPAAMLGGEAVAYMMYTSGSTGIPKGIAVPHRAIARLTLGTDYIKVMPGDGIAHLASPSFDAATFELWGALLNGAAIVIIDRDTTLSSAAFAAVLRERNVDNLFATTALFNRLVQDRPDIFSTVRNVLFGGETADPHTVRTVLAGGGAPQRLLNVYGPTEAATFSTWMEIKALAADARAVPIGRPIANSSCYVLDALLQPVPIGVAGELYLGGDGLAHGYWGRPALTAERFIPDPFGAAGSRLYATGDIVRRLPDGNIEYLSRRDGQVKIRGFRIELSEIEAALRSHPAIEQAAVLARDGAAGKQLVAYVVKTADSAAAPEKWRRHLTASLPDYMVPAHIVLLDSLPLTANGKLDRGALPEPVAQSRNGRLVPSNAIQEILSAIWCDVLQGAAPAIDDNFFASGGHSLIAAQLMGRLNEAFKTQLPLRALFDAPTIRLLAEMVGEAQREEAGIVAPPLTGQTRPPQLPLSYAQEQLWFLDQVGLAGAAYNMAGALRLGGPLDVGALERSIAAIVRRHETLRTRFVLADGHGVQVIAETPHIRLDVIDLSGRDQEHREIEAQCLISDHAQRPFDLGTGPLFRSTLVRLGEREHLLLINMHHIISDGWSLLVLFRELGLLYSADVEGRAAALPALPIQYADYTLWQRSLIDGDGLAPLVDYWRARLDGAPTTLTLETDRPRPAVQSFAGATVPFALPEELSARLAALGCNEGATLYMVMLAAFSLLLFRYTGQQDLLIGSPNASRSRRELEELIGMFVNMLVMRSDLSGDPTFRELLNRIKDSALGAYAHQDLPLEKLVDVLQPERDLSRQPLFQACLSFENIPFDSLELSGLTVRPVETGARQLTTKFDLTLFAHETPSGISCSIEYATDLFERDTIDRMIDHFRRLLGEVANDPDVRISETKLLSGDELRKLVSDWNDIAVPGPHDLRVHEQFANQVAQTPDAIALVSDGRVLTYAALDRRSNQLAHHLRGLGVGPDVVVGLCVERSLDTIIGLLGILKAGGAYLPLDPSYPAERLAYMLADAGANLILTQDTLVEVVQAEGLRRVRLDADWPGIAAHPETAPRCDVGPDNLAYVMYTSGSTGRPKGVGVIHRNIPRLVRNANYVDIRREDVFLHLAPLAFDASTFEVWGALLNGAKLILYPERFVDLHRLRQVIADNGVSVLWLTAGLFHQVVDEDIHALEPLRCLLAGGDVLSVAHVRRVAEQLTCRLINGYGPTEATTFSICHDVSTSLVDARIPIGRPISQAQVYVLDHRMAPVPVGVAGELYIGGIGVARGYLGRPGMTAERFVPSPFKAGERLYRTGDLARWRVDGVVDYLGRIDQQVKIRGFRIELGEIEAALLTHSDVEQAAVVVRDDTGERRLVGYVATRERHVETEVLRQHLQRMLPDHMVPAAMVQLDRLPLSANGKLDRNALPAPDWHGTAEVVTPRNAIEKALAAIWRDVLRLERVSVHDNFFALGGDSIQSIQVVARANRVGLSLTARQVFEQQTIAGLAAVAGTTAAVTAEQGLVMGEVPLTPIQHWFFEQGLAAPRHFNQAVLLACSGLTAALVTAALGALLRHHDALRLRFCRDGENWRQAHAQDEKALQSVCEHIELSDFGGVVQLAALRTHADRLQASLDLANGPLLRAALFDLGAGRQRLILIVHHLVVDGVSWRILLEDFGVALEALQRGEVVQFAPKTTSFRAWAERLAGHACSHAAQGEQAYWQIRPWEEAGRLPRDHKGEINTAESVRVVSSALSVAETQALLQDVPGIYRTQINDVLLTALVESFADWTGQRSLLVALEGHGREDLFDDVDVSRTVGWFTSLFPVLLDLNAASGPGEALKAVKEQLRAVPNRGIGYGLLRYLGGADAVPAPEPEVSFNYLGQIDSGDASGFRLAEEDVGALQAADNTRPHLIDISAHVRDGQLNIQWFYSAKLYDAETITGLAERYSSALQKLIAHCKASEGGLTPSDVPLAGLRQDELDRLVASVGGAALVEDIYPLSPTQQGILFHSLYAPDSTVYVVSLACRLQGELDVDAFEQAWQLAIARHAVLRSAFVDHEREKSLQVVLRRVTPPFTRHDWRAVSGAEQSRRFVKLQHTERAGGFDFARPPLMRFALVRMDEQDYRLLWNSHHILFDGWSMPLLLDDVLSAYSALSRREAPPLTATRPFRDYIAWLQRQDMAAAEAYWRPRLAGFSTPSAIGLGRPTTSAEDRYSEHARELTTALSDIEGFARRHRLTINTLVQGAWALLIGRYGDSDDVVFGVTVSGRPAEMAEVERTVGLFINTLPLRVALPNGATVLDWLRMIQMRQGELTDYQYTPLADVQRWSEVPSGTPLFDSIVAFENYPAEMAALNDLTQTLQISDVQPLERTNYPLTLQVTVTDKLSFRLISDNERFETAAVERLMDHLVRLLNGIVTDPNARLSSLSLLDDAERNQAVFHFNDTAVGYPQNALLHALFAAQAARTPDAVALRFAEKALTYGELDRRANQLSHYLHTLRVGPDVVVGVCAERSFEMVIALLGILKAGGAYLSLDPSYPAERLAYMLDDSKAPVLLVQAALADRLPTSDATVVRLDADWPEIARQAETMPDITIDPSSLAYVIYTSGSTGRPKGVMNAHRGIVNRIAWMQDAYHLTPADRVMQKTPFGFDVSVWEFFWPLAHGAELVIALPGGHQDPAYLAELIDQAKVTIIHFVPSMLQAFLEAADLARCGSLRDTICSGEALPAETQNRFLSALPSSRLHNLYGPTEAAVDVSAWSCQLEPTATQVPIGRPISNIQLYVLDRDFAPVPVGVAGELYIGGIGVARGYLGRPALTAERFIPSPFKTGERLYRTGDLARWRSDGALDYLGRTDHQVKIRGFRIELGEIEAALLAHPDVEQAAVLARDDIGERKLVGYVATRDGRVETESLRRHLQQMLPDHMIPSATVQLDKLPLSANGKLDRNALPAPDWHGAGASDAVAPRNATEETLAAIWRDVLKLEHVSIHDSFFALGGDSIHSIQLVARANRVGLSLTARQVFEQQTIAGLAAVAGRAIGMTAEQGLVAGEMALTPIQHWFFEQDLAAPEHFNQAVLLGCERLTPALIAEAMGALLRHHDALRLRFRHDEGSRRQVHATDEAAFQTACDHIDLSEFSDVVQPAALKTHADRLQASLDLADGPLLRAALFDLGAGAQRLLLTIHHLVIDGVSWRILLEDLAAALAGLQRGEQIKLPAKTTSFSAWVERLTSHAVSPVLQRELTYWQQRPWSSTGPLPRDNDGAANTAGSAHVVSRALTVTETQALLLDVASVYHTQINDVLLTALVEAFADWTGRRSLLVALEGHGREELFADVDVSRTVGWFTSLFPVLLDINVATDPGEALKAVKEELRAVPSRGIGYGLLRYLNEVASVPAVQPEISFNYLGQLDGVGDTQTLRFASEDVGAAQSAGNARAHLIDVSAHVRDGRLQMHWAYSTAVHQTSTIEVVAESFVAHLQNLIAHCEASEGGFTVSDFPLLQGSLNF